MTNAVYIWKLGDTLLSLLAVRAGEVVDSILGAGDPQTGEEELANGLTNGCHAKHD